MFCMFLSSVYTRAEVMQKFPHCGINKVLAYLIPDFSETYLIVFVCI